MHKLENVTIVVDNEEEQVHEFSKSRNDSDIPKCFYSKSAKPSFIVQKSKDNVLGSRKILNQAASDVDIEEIKERVSEMSSCSGKPDERNSHSFLEEEEADSQSETST
jgi:hypothetical protein